jgi:signal peptide peptidase SppA
MPHERHPITGCNAAALFGFWWIDAQALEAITAQALSYDLLELHKHNQMIQMEEQKKAEADKDKPPKPPYVMMDKTAVIGIDDATTKHGTSFSSVMGGCSTVFMTKAIRHASQNGEVERILIHFDGAPGGTVDGAYDFAEAIMKADKIKPVVGHADDMVASGAYLFGSACRRLTANMNCQVGSIGTMSRLIDTSGNYEKNGIKVIPITTGKFKGIGMPGVGISEDQIAHVKERITDLNQLFIRHVASRRHLSQKEVKGLEASIFIANKAKDLGLVDQVCSLEEAMSLPVPEPRGTRTVVSVPATQTGADPARRKAMPLTAQQIENARKLGLPVLANITEENADVVLYEATNTFQQRAQSAENRVKELEQAAPAKVTPSIAALTIKPFVRELDVLQKEGRILPEQHTLIKDAVLDKDGKAKIDAVSPEGEIMISADVITKVLDANKPSGLTQIQTGAQPAPKQDPGGNQITDPSQVPAERQSHLLSHVGVVPQHAGGGAK